MTKNKKRKVIIIIDGNHCCHRAYHAMARMSYKGRGTGVVFGFLQIMFGATERFSPDKVIACFDGGRHKERLNILPTYKQRENRVDLDYEDFDRQRKGVMKMLYRLGIPQLRANGQEADDFIYTLVNKYEAKGWKVIIVSGDKDFRQLVSRRVWIYDNNKGVITPLNFVKNFEIRPEQYADFLCLDGDTSDKIPGVPGIGPKTAIKFLTQHGSIQNYIGDGKNSRDNKYAIIRDTYHRNRVLINLRVFDQLFGPQELTYYKDKSKPKPNVDKYLTLCSKFGIKKFTEQKYLDTLP